MIGNTFVAVLLAVALILGLILLGMINRQRKFTKSKHGDSGIFKKDIAYHKWQEIQDLIAVKKPSAMKQAVIEADKLLDYVLRGQRFRGETLGERLKSARQKISDNDGIWYAHKLRNRLVHETEYEVQVFEMRDALRHFEKTLRELGGI